MLTVLVEVLTGFPLDARLFPLDACPQRVGSLLCFSGRLKTGSLFVHINRYDMETDLLIGVLVLACLTTSVFPDAQGSIFIPLESSDWWLVYTSSCF